MNAIKRARLKRGMTQERLACEMNINQATVSMWETGESMPRVNTLLKLAKILECTVDELLTRET